MGGGVPACHRVEKDGGQGKHMLSVKRSPWGSQHPNYFKNKNSYRYFPHIPSQLLP